jgi:hypothetical protein
MRALACAAVAYNRAHARKQKIRQARVRKEFGNARRNSSSYTSPLMDEWRAAMLVCYVFFVDSTTKIESVGNRNNQLAYCDRARVVALSRGGWAI